MIKGEHWCLMLRIRPVRGGGGGIGGSTRLLFFCLSERLLMDDGYPTSCHGNIDLEFSRLGHNKVTEYIQNMLMKCKQAFHGICIMACILCHPPPPWKNSWVCHCKWYMILYILSTTYRKRIVTFWISINIQRSLYVTSIVYIQIPKLNLKSFHANVIW